MTALDFQFAGSVTQFAFSVYCQVRLSFALIGKLICVEYLKALLTPFNEELLEAKEDLKPNSDRLMEVTQKILASILKSLSSSPE